MQSSDQVIAMLCRHVDAARRGGFDGEEHPECRGVVMTLLGAIGLDAISATQICNNEVELVPVVLQKEMLDQLGQIRRTLGSLSA